MKNRRFVPAALLVTIAVIMFSCSPSREYVRRDYPPRPGPGFSLIISSSPGLVVLRGPAGRYYYRDPRGYIYWRGYDNRFYLDRKYVTRSYYHHNQYNDWRRHYRR